MANEENGPFKGGRPYAITDPQKLRAAIDAYFKMCDPRLERRLADSGRDAKGETIWQEREVMTHQKPYTMSGLARAIGVNCSTLLAYKDAAHFSDEIPEDVRQQLIDSVADALARCEEFAEDNLFGPFSAGATTSRSQETADSGHDHHRAGHDHG